MDQGLTGEGFEFGVLERGAQRNGAYIEDLIERLPMTRPSELGELLPATWAAVNRAAHPAIKSERSQAA